MFDTQGASRVKKKKVAYHNPWVSKYHSRNMHREALQAMPLLEEEALVVRVMHRQGGGAVVASRVPTTSLRTAGQWCL